MQFKKVIIGTRESKLALIQTNQIKTILEKIHPGISFYVRIIKSKGDRDRKTPLTKIKGTGFFVKELEDALLRKEIDLAVHSLKDLPVELPPGLTLGAVTHREIPNDALVSKDKVKFNQLSYGATVATSSLRRKLFLKYLRPDLRVVPIRGNLNTRLKKLLQENLDAIVVAACGLYRMGLKSVIGEIFPTQMILPSAGQGCLAVEVREDDETIRELVAGVNHPRSWWETLAEREFIHRLGGGCHLPIGVLARADNESLHIEGAIISKKGEKLIRTSVSGTISEALSIGKNLADKLLEMGVREIMREEIIEEEDE